MSSFPAQQKGKSDILLESGLIMTIKGFWYENAFHASFVVESDSSYKRDQLLVMIDNRTYECGTADIVPCYPKPGESDNQAEIYLICLDSDDSEVTDPTGIAFILDIPSGTMTFRDKDGDTYVQLVAIDKDDETGQIAAIWGDPVEREVVGDYTIADMLAMSPSSDEEARIRTIMDNLENLIVE
jgi:hypothetical protein